jgi:hypothetical protein
MKQVFTIVPGSSGPFWLLAAIGVFLVAMVFLFAYMAYSSRNVKFELSDSGLQITGDIYGRTIAVGSLVVDGAKILDLDHDTDYRLKWRTNGAGLPGYKAGWFKLRNGEKSLVFVTDTRRVVYLPTTEGYSLLMSVAKPSEFTQALAGIAN